MTQWIRFERQGRVEFVSERTEECWVQGTGSD